MAQGKSLRNPLAFASVLYPGRCLAVELANPEPTGSSQQGTPRTITELFALALPVFLCRFDISLIPPSSPVSLLL